MNVKRGFFRIWIVFTIICWVITSLFVVDSYFKYSKYKKDLVTYLKIHSKLSKASKYLKSRFPEYNDLTDEDFKIRLFEKIGSVDLNIKLPPGFVWEDKFIEEAFKSLSNDELVFWQKMIKNKFDPIAEDARVESQLIEIINGAVFGYLLVPGIFLAIGLTIAWIVKGFSS